MKEGKVQFPWASAALVPSSPEVDVALIDEMPVKAPTPRAAFELAAMQYFNARKQFGTHYVDAGELGILLLGCVRGCWTRRWIELERLA